jgi:hypothetical protein
LRVDAREEHFLEDALDQVLLGREVAIEQRLRYMKPLGQLPRMPAEPDFGEKAYGLGDDLPLAVGGSEALAGLAARRAAPTGDSCAVCAFARGAAIAGAGGDIV